MAKSKKTATGEKTATGAKRTKTDKKTPKIKRHKFSGKLAKPTAKTGLSATRNQHGRRLGGAAHFISVVLFAAKKPLSGSEIAEQVEAHCKKSGVAPRASGSYSNQLNSMALEEIAEQKDGGWQLTSRGRKLWSGGAGVTRAELRKGRTLSEVRTAFHAGKPLSKLTAAK